MKVMLLHVELNILVEREVTPVAFIPEGLELGQDGRSAGNHFWSTQKLGVKGLVCLTAIFGLRERLAVCPPTGLSPPLLVEMQWT